MSDHSLDEVVQVNGAALVVQDAKEVYVRAINRTVVVSSNALTTDKGRTFVKLCPRRHKSVEKILLSRCNKQARSHIAANRTFWTSKGSKGRAFLAELRKQRQAAIKAKFTVVGNRFMTRKKHERSKQILEDVIEVPLPRVGQSAGIIAEMIVDVDALRKNGRSALWCELTSNVIDHIAQMANDRFANADVDESAGGSEPSGGESDESVNVADGSADADEDAAAPQPQQSKRSSYAIMNALFAGSRK